MQNGIWRLDEILSDLHGWKVEHEYASVNQRRGSMSQMRVDEPAAFERAQYVKTVGTLEPADFQAR